MATSAPSAMRLETRVPTARSQAALGYLKVDGLKVTYVGPGVEDSEAATVRTNIPVPADCPVFYFEIKVLSRGMHGFIGMGFQTEEVLLSRLPGWDPHSYGYHGDDGFAFGGSGQGTPYGPQFTTGDVVGAMFSRVDNSIRFFKNGVDLGVAFRGIPEERLFPCVGLRTRGEEVQMNLGRAADPPFSTDISGVVKTTIQAQVLSAVSRVPLPTAAYDGSPLLPRLLYDHLLHHRCWQTAAVLRRDLAQAQAKQREAAALAAGTSQGAGPMDTGDPPPGLGSSASDPGPSHPPQPPPASSTPTQQQEATAGPMAVDGGGAPGGGGQGAANPPPGGATSTAPPHVTGLEGDPGPHVAVRQTAFELVSSGRPLEARQLLVTHFGSSILDTNPGLDFRLKVSHFCELARPGGASALEAAVTYGRAELAPHTPKSATDDELLCDALSLLAYEDPASSPCGHLLSQGVRVGLAEDVDRAILAACGLPPTSPLERLTAHVLVTLDALKHAHDPQALLLDARDVVLRS